MRFELTDNLLTLFFEGELNSYNADVVEKEIDEVLSSSKFQTLNLDFAKLNYISSAGLRIILKIKQKHDDSHVINANLDVYDVLQMTGFTNIMDVKKAMREMSVEGAEIIGEGFFSTVYRIDKDTIIKVFNRTSDEKQIERELKLAKQAFVLGIPTAISFDIVRVKDKLGVRFEMLDCMSLKNAFIKYPEKYDELLNKYVALLKKINTTECFDPSVPSIKRFFIEKVDALKPLFDEAHYEKLLGLMKSVPERSTFVHGDCHFKNIMVQGEDFLLIDMDTLSVGHPIFELANLRCPYVAFEEDAPGNCEQFFGMKAEYCVKLYDDIVRLYFGKEDEVIKDKIALVCYAHMVWWTLTNQKDNQKRLDGCKERLIALLDKYDDIDIGI